MKQNLSWSFGWFVGLLVVVVVALGGCFSPTFDEGRISCGPNDECPPGLSCAADKVCRATSAPKIDAQTIDAPMGPDADVTAPEIPTITAIIPGGAANNDNSVIVMGTAEAGTTVTIFENGCTTVTTTGTAAQFASPGLLISVVDDTTTQFRASAKDAAGNASSCSSSITYVEDSSAPNPPALVDTLPASPSRSLTPKIRGTAEANATIVVYDNASCTGTPLMTGDATAAGDFEIAITVTSASTTTVYALARDVAGNVSTCSSSSVDYQQDASSLSPPTFTATVPVSPSQVNTTPSIAGTTEAGVEVKLYTTSNCASAVVGMMTSDGTGQFTIPVTVAANSTTTFYGIATDVAVAVSSVCSPIGITYVHDTIAPAAPVVGGSTPSSPSNATAPSVTGTAEALATVALFATSDCSGTLVGSGVVAADGTFSAPVTITGTTTFRGTVTDRAGNVSTCSTTSFTYVYDNVMPAAPVISTTIPTSPSTTNNTPTVVGSAETNSTVRLFTSADCTGTEAASSIASGGAFGIGMTVASNSTTPISASSTDPAGNRSACSSPVTYVHDSLVPAAPVITTATPGSPSNTNTPAIAGTTEAAATIRLYTDATCTTPIGSSVVADSGGAFTVTITVTDNTTTTLYARATDSATNVSPCSAPFTYVEDSTAPTTPTLDPLAPSATSTTPTLLGTAEASSSVAIYASTTCSGAVFASGPATAGGAFAIMVTVTANTTTSFTARTTDGAGNVSACSPAIAYTHDNVAPGAPTALATTPISPAGSNTPSVTGNAEAASTVRLFSGPTCGTGVAGTAIATVGGTFAVPLTVANGSTTTFYATTTDPAGNVSPCSASFVTYTEDSSSPPAPTGLATTPTSPSSSNTPSVTGSAESGATVQLYTSATCAGAAAFSGTASAGAFSIPITVGADTTTTFYATATDSATNTSPCSTASVTYVEDSIAPTVPDLAATTPTSPANNNGPAVTGTAEVGALVKLYTSATCATAVVASGTADAVGGFSIAVTVGDNSNTTYYATATDAAGNASTCSSGRNYVEDSLAPTTPTGLSTTPVSPISNSNPSITGSAETGSTVSVYTSITCAGAAAGQGAATGGAFAIPVTVGANTTTTFYARATDAAGNQSSCSSGVSYIEDSSTPEVPILLATTPASPAANASPTVTGTAEANSTVRIYSGSCATLLATGTASAGGTFAIPTPVIANAITILRATATDLATNVSGCSTTSLTYTHDSVVPAAPTGLAASPASPANNNNPTITGSAEAGTTVTLYATATCMTSLGTGVATGGAFAIGVSVVDNSTTTVYAKATDAAGNSSACSTSNAPYVEDSTAPSAPSGLATTPISPSSSTSPSVTGTAENGATIQLFTNGSCTGSPTATGTSAGSFAIAVAVAASSTTTFYARAIDAANNTSACSTSNVVFVQDSAPPSVPSGLMTTPASPSSNNNPAVSGTTEANASVSIYSNATCTTLVASGAANGAGGFSIVAPVLADSTTTFYAKATDLAGNPSACSTSFATYVEDSTPPSAPTALAVSPTSPGNDTTPTVSGSATTGTTVKIYADAMCLTLQGTGAVTAGAFAIATTVTANTTTTFYATATDPANNVSACSTSFVTYVEDESAPAVPSGLTTTPTSPSSSNTTAIKGTAEAGSTVTIYNDACTTQVATGTAAAFASSGITITVSANSTTTLRATATDAAGNVSACSTGVTYVEDSTPPSVPIIASTTPGSPANDTTPIVNGTAEVASTVTLYSNAACTTLAGSGTATGGAFAIAATAVADNSTTTYFATATDAAGNVSTCTSTGFTFVEDSIAPTVAMLTTSPTSPANNNTPTISGMVESGATVTAWTNATCSGGSAGSTIGAGGTFSLNVSVADNITTTFYLRATDAALNVSTCGAAGSTITYQEDSSAVDVPVLVSTTPASPSSTDTTPTLNGTAGAGLSINLYTNAMCSGAPVATGTASALGAFAITATVTANTTTTFYATATNAIPNTSQCSSGLTYVHDGTAPAAPTGLAVTPTSPANNNTPTISGSAEPGATVRLWTNATCTAPAGAAGSGAAAAGVFSIAVSAGVVLDNTTTTFYATATDAAGNVSACSTSTVVYVEDSSAPALPTLTSTTPTSPSSVSTAPSINGSAETGATVRIYPTADCTGATAGTSTAAAGVFSVAVTVSANSTTTFKATATDAAGNTSACSASSIIYVHDNQAPNAPTGLASSPVSPANNNSPTIIGGASTGTTVRLYTNNLCTVPAASAGSGTAVAGAFSIVVGAGIVTNNTTTTFYATATDAANNVSACSTSNVVYVEDSTAPGTPAITGSTPASPSKTITNPTINGTAEVGATVSLYTAAACTTPVASGPASGGAFAIAVTVTANTTTTFFARATDAAGNASGCTATAFSYTHDTIVPTTPTGLAVVPASPANNNAPSLTGTSELGATIGVYTDATCTTLSTTGSAGAGGLFSTPLSVADNTTTTFYVKATDLAGNASACSAGVTYTEDSAAPGTPVVTGTSPASPSNASTTPSVTGTAEAGATVHLYTSALCATSVASGIAAAGSFSIATTVTANTSTTFYAKAFDAAGNASACSATSATYVHDNAAPATPTGLATTPASPSSQTSVSLSGSGESGATINLYFSGACSGAIQATTTAVAPGAFSMSFTATANAVTTVSVRAVDAAGNSSGCSAALSYIHDSIAPGVPVFTGATPGTPSTSNTPNINGTAETGSTVLLYTTSACTTAAYTGAASGTSFAIPISVGDNTSTTLYARAVDAAGNASACTIPAAAFTYVEDSTAPAAPVVVGTSPTSPSNASTTPSVTGTAEAGATVNIYSNASCVTLLASGSAAGGNFSIPTTVTANSMTTFYAKATDGAGNSSTCSMTSTTYQHDNLAPASPTSLVTSPVSPSTQTSITVSGIAESGANVRVYLSASCGGAAVATTTAAASEFSASLTVPPNAATAITARATDAAGNVSTCSLVLTYTHDSIAPGVPAITSTTPGSPSNSNSPTVNGTANAGVTVTLYTSAACTTSAGTGVATSGAFAIQISVSANAVTSIFARATDAAGNASACTATAFTYTEDSTPPSVPLLTGSSPGSPSNSNTPSLSGTTSLEAATIRLYADGACTGSIIGTGTSSAASGGFAVVATVAPNIMTDIFATATDVAGNTSACSSRFSYTEDSIAPAAPTGLVTTPSSPSSSNTPTVTLTAEAGTTVKLYVGAGCSGAVYGSATSASTAFSIAMSGGSLPSNTTSTIFAQASDAASNLGPCSAGLAYIEDSIANAPVLSSTSPASPSAGDNTPTINGTAEVNSTVFLYTTVGCSGAAVASGTATLGSFSLAGGTVAANVTTTYYGKITDVAGNTSACTATGLAYVYDTGAPVFDNTMNAAVATATDQITVSWLSATDNFTSAANMRYDVCVSTSVAGCASFTITATTTAGTTSHNLTGLTASQRYWIRVRPVDQAGNPGTPSTDISERTFGSGATLAIAAAQDFTCALISDGTVRCWGDNAAGQLGNGTNVASLTPVTVSGLTNVVSLSAGGISSLGASHACAVKSDGEVWCWGSGTYGELGNGANTASNVPVNVSSISNAISVSAGPVTSCAVLTTGFVRCWGYGGMGNLGNAASANSNVPVTVSSMTTAVAVDVGFRFTCARLANGGVNCWGDGSLGKLGNGATGNSNVPVAVAMGAGEQARALDVGAFHACVIIQSGQVRCWGANLTGQLGNNTTTDSSTPVTVLSSVGVPLATSMSISAGGTYVGGDNYGTTCVTRAAGSVRCWGYNASGQIGNGNTTNQLMATLVSSSTNTARAVSTGAEHVCLVKHDGSLRCWGEGSNGRLGTGTTTDHSTSVAITLTAPEGAMAMEAGGDTTCTLLTNGTVKCFGQGTSGQLGNAAYSSVGYPLDPVTDGTLVGNDAISMDSGQYHSCAARVGGEVACWGSGTNGQLGDGTTVSKNVAVAVSGIMTATMVAAGDYHACALLAGGTVQCWGYNGYGALGNGTTTESTTPVTVSGLAGATSIAALGYSTCALIADGTVKCWGRNHVGQLGDGTTTQSTTPVTVLSATTGTALTSVTKLAAGRFFGCALIVGGTLRCWGGGVLGQMGNGTTTITNSSAVATNGNDYVDVVAGFTHACATRTTGTNFCWGENGQGQLGDTTTTDRLVPTQTVVSSTSDLAASGDHSCALHSDGAAECWGEANYGQVGDGVTSDHDQATPDFVLYFP